MDLAFLAAEWLGKPSWMWLGFFAVVGALLMLDLGVLHRSNREIGVRESLLLSSGYIGLGLLFGGWVWWQLGPDRGAVPALPPPRPRGPLTAQAKAVPGIRAWDAELPAAVMAPSPLARPALALAG